MIEKYRELGLDLGFAVNPVVAGLSTVWALFVGNQLKIFKNLGGFWQEFRLYRRGRDRMSTEPVEREAVFGEMGGWGAWMT